MSYVNDERLADEALQWWQRYPDSVQALVSMLDDTASDEHGNVLGSVSWHHENSLEITLAGSNGLLYSARKARKDDGWHVFHLVADEKELQKRLKRRLQWSNEADKMNTHSNEIGNDDMTYGEKRDYKKIDIFVNGEYMCSTTWAKTCKIAKQRYADKNGIDVSNVKAFFSK